MTTPVSGVMPDDARGHDQRGQDQEERQRRRQKEPVVAGGEAADAEAAPGEDGEEPRNADKPDRAELLADGREDQVGVAGRQIARVAKSETGAEHAARRHGPRWRA